PRAMKQQQSRLRGRSGSWPRTKPRSNVCLKKLGQWRGIQRTMPPTARAYHFFVRVSRKQSGGCRRHPGCAGVPRGRMQSADCQGGNGNRRHPDPCTHPYPHSCFRAASERRSLGQPKCVRSRSLCGRSGQDTFALCLSAVRRRTACLHRSRIRYDRGRHNTGDACALFFLSAGCWTQTKACSEDNFTPKRRNAVIDYEPVKTSFEDNNSASECLTRNGGELGAKSCSRET